ncbi:MAG TPA: glycosyltransferase [Xanthobacteraceae bacterium]
MEAVDKPALSEAEQQAFFATMLAATRAAQARQPEIIRCITVAGVRIRLRFGGAALHDMLIGPLSHLLDRNEDGPVDAVFNIWDSASTRVGVPAPPCPRGHFTDRGDIWGMESERILSAFHWLECSIALMDTQSLEAIYWVDDAKALPYWSKASPLRTLLHWLMQRFGRQLLHAAVVGTDQGGVVITGRGGAGKSTAALLCLEAGLAYLGDDYVVIALDPEPRAYSLYCTAKLNDEQAANFPGLLPLREPRTGQTHAEPEKTVFRLHPARADRIRDSIALRAILLPVISDQEGTFLVAADLYAAERSAAFTTLAHLPRAGRWSQAFIVRLCQSLPRFELRLGRDLAAIPDAIRRFLAGVPDQPAQQPAAPAGAPRISVIIPVFNGVRFLPGAVRSVLAQDYPSLDIIIVDDGSTEDVAAAVRALPTDVRLFRQENAGPAAARNRGIREATGELLAFLDVDDEWPAGNLQHMSTVLRTSPGLDVVIGHNQLMRGDADGREPFVGNPLENFPWSIAAALFRREVFTKIGLFDETLRFGEDSDWFKRAEEAALVVERLPNISLLVRRHGGNMTRGKSMVELNQLRVLKKALDRQRGR